MMAFRVIAFLLTLSIAGQVLADGGEVLGVTTLLNSGDSAQKIDLVFLGDGFTVGEQDVFNSKVDLAVKEFLSAHPIFALRSAFNIHRVNVSSPESGTDKFANCGGNDTGDPNQARRTAMDSGYCAGGAGTVYRCLLTSNDALALGFAERAPDDNIVIVLVNDAGHGGCARGNLTFFSIKDDFEEVAVHEMGHAIFGLADEYQYDREDTYTGPEPGAVNVTRETNRAALKWLDLLLDGTAVPTQSHGAACSVSNLPDRAMPEDIVGTFEGAFYRRCGIYRSEYFCKMRESNRPFCAVCRRAIIRTLVPRLSADLSTRFTELLIRDDEDPWPRGQGEIYLNYDLRSRDTTVSGRWPSSGESDFDDDETQKLNVFAGLLPAPAAGAAASIAVRVRESDWPDGDDSLSDDADQGLPATGAFTVDRADYRLNGEVQVAALRVLMDTLNIKDDQDGFFAGDGDIYVNYSISNGDTVVTGRWPNGDGTVGMSDGDTAQVAILAGAIPLPVGNNALTISVTVMDEDSFLTFGDDEVGSETFSLVADQGFGTTQVIHPRDNTNYRLTVSVVGGPMRGG